MDTAPKFLYRCFDNEAHALAFLNSGQIRLGILGYYAEIEDSNRNDSSEGVAHFEITEYCDETGAGSTEKGIYRERSLNATYVYCTSGPEVNLDYAREKFGRFIVKIHAPYLFLKCIRAASLGREIINWRLKQVEYTKGLPQKVDLSKRVPGEGLSTYQKPPSFSPECEYRYIVETAHLTTANPPKFMNINLNYRHEFLEQLWGNHQ